MKAVTIQTTNIGSTLGNTFSIFTDADSYTTPIETGITSTQLNAGYTSLVVPNTATKIKLYGSAVCGKLPINGQTIGDIPPTPTPTPTNTTTPTNTVTPSITPTHTTTPTPTVTPTTTPAVLNYNGGKFDYDFQNFRTYPGTGLTFKDVTNSGNDATLITGATYQGSVSPYYYNMDSTYATSLYNPPNYYGYLYGGWFKVETTGVANVFMKKGDGLELGITSGNTIYAFFQNVVDQTRTLTAENMIPGYWYYIMAYYDYNLTGVPYLYVNGILQAEGPSWGISNPNLKGTGTPFILGNGAATQSFQLGEAECYAQFYGGIANVPTIVSYNMSQKSQFYTIRPTPTPTPTNTPTASPAPIILQYNYSVGSLGNTQWAKDVINNRMYGDDQTAGCIAQPANLETFYGASTGATSTNFCSFTNGRLYCVRGINYRRPVGAGGTTPKVTNSTISLYKNGVLQQTKTLAGFTLPNGATSTRYDTISFTGLTINNGQTWRIDWAES